MVADLQLPKIGLVPGELSWHCFVFRRLLDDDVHCRRLRPMDLIALLWRQLVSQHCLVVTRHLMLIAQPVLFSVAVAL